MKTSFASLIAVAAFALSGCGAPSSGGGVGFGTPQPTASATSASAQSTSLGKSPQPGLYKTASGVPWKVYQSYSLRHGRGPVSEFEAMKDVIRQANNMFLAPPMIDVSNEKGGAKFALMTIDGRTFGVVGKYKAANFFATGIDYKAEAIDILERGIKMAGCQPRRDDAVVRTAGYNGPTAGAAMPANC
ncbi:MAG: hypothetical protein AAGF55_09235 [Pseudomonadota bacterium]